MLRGDPSGAGLPRITVLVGENGTGKSTFLGCARAIARRGGSRSS